MSKNHGIWVEKADRKSTVLVDGSRMNGHIKEYRVIEQSTSSLQYWLPEVALLSWYERVADAN